MKQCLGAGLQSLARGWGHLQVELSGQYSAQRLQALHAYATQTSVPRSIAVFLLTPLLCLVVVVVIETIPLEPPERGFLHNYGFWARSFVATGVFTLSILIQCEAHVVDISLSNQERGGIVLIVSALMLAVEFPLSMVIGFPVPFFISLTSAIWLPLVIISLRLARGHQIRESEAIRTELQQFARIGVAQTAATVVYQAFYAAFSQMSSNAQPKFVLLLSVLNLAQKNVISRLMHDNDDSKPEVVTFNVELFHCMFVSCCMQRSTSASTSFVLIAVDFIQACVSLYDLNSILSDVERLANANGIEKEEFVAVALRITRRDPGSQMASTALAMRPADDGPPLEPTSAVKWLKTSRVFPSSRLQKHPVRAWIHPTPDRGAPRKKFTRSAINALSVDQQELFVRQFLRAMFLAEFLLLIEFVEVMIPVAYCVYLAVLSQLPSRVFYPHMAYVDDEKLRSTVRSVLLYATIELGSFLALSAMIRRRLPISGLHHLAFVLETQVVRIQSKLVLWFLFVLQSTLAHLGTDYSFQFAWLRTPPSPSA